MGSMTVARIRPAHGGDAETIHQLLLDTWREAYSEHLPESSFTWLEETGLETWEQILIEPEGTWIAHRDGTPVGFARAIATGAGQVRPLELEKLYVRASEYGKSTAANLLEISVGDAPCQTWVANYNTRAQRFYEKMGFVLDDSPEGTVVDTKIPGISLHRWIR